jgi:hypothetical protein
MAGAEGVMKPKPIAELEEAARYLLENAWPPRCFPNEAHCSSARHNDCLKWQDMHARLLPWRILEALRLAEECYSDHHPTTPYDRVEDPEKNTYRLHCPRCGKIRGGGILDVEKWRASAEYQRWIRANEAEDWD